MNPKKDIAGKYQTYPRAAPPCAPFLMLTTIGNLQFGNSLPIHETSSVVSAMFRRTYRYKSLSLNFPARTGGLVATDIKGESSGDTQGTAREKSDCQWW